ncbi:sulfotransferase family protein [Algiphilus aromaticivorans]|uniref:sulfotransferase family protein n=1 Tax=Algiphilus aromaticivorans TaxID=382454 RepID=UPI0018DDF1AC|nr:sulfotransferase [Algiphilus aromaticivorans]
MNLRWTLRRLRAYIGRPRTEIQIKAVSLDDGDRCKNPIFLIGVHRSGTSLTRRILNSHPSIACPPESFFFSHFVEMMADPLTYAGFRGLGYEDQAEVDKCLAKLASVHHEQYRIACGKARWADKTPQYTAIIPQLGRLFGSRAQFVLLYRHPYDIVHSIYSLGWEMGEGGRDRFENNVLYVRERLSMMLDFERTSTQGVHRIKYEELVANPEAELKATCDFLGEEYCDSMLDFNSGNHNVGTEDSQVRGTSKFQLSSNNWGDLSFDKMRVLKEHLSDIVSELGY